MKSNRMKSNRITGEVDLIREGEMGVSSEDSQYTNESISAESSSVESNDYKPSTQFSLTGRQRAIRQGFAAYLSEQRNAT